MITEYYCPSVVESFFRAVALRTALFARPRIGWFFSCIFSLSFPRRYVPVFAVAFTPMRHYTFPLFVGSHPTFFPAHSFLRASRLIFLPNRCAANLCALRKAETPQFALLPGFAALLQFSNQPFIPCRPRFQSGRSATVFYPGVNCSVLPGYLTPGFRAPSWKIIF